MDNFNIKRFRDTAAWTAMTTRKEIITVTGTMSFAFIMPFAIHLLSSHGKPGWYVANSLHSALQTCSAIHALLIMICGCWIFNNMSTKEQRLTFKMLPASDPEKFAVRFLYVIVAWPLMSLTAFCAADLLRILVSASAGFEWVRCTVPDFIGLWISDSDNHNFTVWRSGLNPTAISAVLTAGGFWIQSAYMLGGAFFRRRQFVLTSCVLTALSIIFSFALGGIKLHSIKEHITAEHINCAAYTATALLAALTLLNWWLSYRIFKRMQIINNRWTNI